jgi:hypothetical protein
MIVASILAAAPDGAPSDSLVAWVIRGVTTLGLAAIAYLLNDTMKTIKETKRIQQEHTTQIALHNIMFEQWLDELAETAVVGENPWTPAIRSDNPRNRRRHARSRREGEAMKRWIADLATTNFRIVVSLMLAVLLVVVLLAGVMAKIELQSEIVWGLLTFVGAMLGIDVTQFSIKRKTEIVTPPQTTAENATASTVTTAPAIPAANNPNDLDKK